MNREELRSYIGITGYSLGQVEKDYFQHMILGALSRKSGAGLVFKGGTALQKIGIIPRFSEDLDFTLVKDLTLQGLIDNTLSVVKNYNFIAEADNLVDDERTLDFRIKIQGPLYRNRQGICTIRIEVSKREPVLLEPDRKELTPPYSDILPYIIYIMQKEEILSEKIRAIYTRHRARDLYDISKILKKGARLDIDLANKKLEYYDLTFDASTFLRNCERLEPNWENELQSLLEDIIPYKRALSAVKDMLSEG
ncbi:MAG: nucleotidyl transferase AbiEii/AbiGii toxin family protein [Thermoplasmata archaeon]